MTEHNSLIPKWTTNNDQQDELEAYLASLKEAARLQICETEQLLIYASLQKSNKIDIYLSLNLKQKTNITDFASFLRKNFSSTPDEQRAELASIRQKSDESPQQLLKRIEKKYFQIKGVEVPNELESHEKSDIRHLYINALNDPTVQRHLILGDYEYDNLGQEARRVQNIFKNATRVYSINDARSTDYGFSYQDYSDDSNIESEWSTSQEE